MVDEGTVAVVKQALADIVGEEAIISVKKVGNSGKLRIRLNDDKVNEVLDERFGDRIDANFERLLESTVNDLLGTNKAEFGWGYVESRPDDIIYKFSFYPEGKPSW